MNHWSDHYVGLPHVDLGRDRTGCDCWGLAKIIYREQLGIELPDYVTSYVSDDEHTELAAIIDGATTSPLWSGVTGLAMPYDIGVFRRGRLDTHIGIVVHDGLMIHSAREDCAKIETYRSGAWSHRLTGIYRHRERLSKTL